MPSLNFRRFKVMVNNIPQPIVLLNKKGEIAFANQSCRDLIYCRQKTTSEKPCPCPFAATQCWEYEKNLISTDSLDEAKIYAKDIWTQKNEIIPVEVRLKKIFLEEDALTIYLATIKDMSDRNRLAQNLAIKTQHLDERVKELNCLHHVLLILETDMNMEKKLTAILDKLPHAFKYSEDVEGSIQVRENKVFSAGWKRTPWRLSSRIKADGKDFGSIEIYYMKDLPLHEEGPFLLEERHLIDSVAKMIGEHIDRKDALSQLAIINESLETKVEEKTKELEDKRRWQGHRKTE